MRADQVFGFLLTFNPILNVCVAPVQHHGPSHMGKGLSVRNGLVSHLVFQICFICTIESSMLFFWTGMKKNMNRVKLV